MLVAEHGTTRIDAEVAERGPVYNCPGCGGEVVLKRGRIVIAHFAHKPPTKCDWSKGETLAHLRSKRLIQSVFRSRGLRAEVEFLIGGGRNKNRADIAVWSPTGRIVAIEMQHSNISLDEIERRAFSYAEQEIGQIWVPFLRDETLRGMKYVNANEFLVERYPARPFERWIQALNYGVGIWMYDPKGERMYCCIMDKCWVGGEESSWYDEYGDEQYGGGPYVSRRYKKLTLLGPCDLENLKLKKFKHRKEWSGNKFKLPSGDIYGFQGISEEK